ncbi:MAG: hypothetical protein HYX22_01955, partial [Candidatus Yanofskybacteria bacterium]|nr:hypothetical protein [Candidatus Yanofskybacteria bacterium]
MSYIKNKYKFVIVSSVVFAVIAGFVFSVDTYPVQGASYLGCKAIKTLTGHYAVAEGGGGGAMNANITAISDWGKFEIMDVGNGEIAFKTFAGYYAVAEGGGGGDLNANRTAVGGWEKFRIIDVGGGKVAFQTLTGHYAVAEGGGGGAMNANRTAIGGWEQFELVDTSGCSAPKPTATPAPSQPTVSNLPTCSTGSYNATISWTGTPNSSFGFYVDIDDGDQNFGTF